MIECDLQFWRGRVRSSATRSSASARSVVNGFSQSTCLPASSAARTGAVCAP